MPKIDQLRLHLGPAPAWLRFHGSPLAAASRGTVLFWHGFTSRKETHEKELCSLAEAGFLAVGLDAVDHGERRPDDFEQRYAGSGPAFDGPFFHAVRATADEAPAVVDALTERGWAQPGRLGVVGISMGGCVVYRALQIERRVTAAVALLGLPEWRGSVEVSPHRWPAAFFPAALLSQVAGADQHVSPGPARALHAALVPYYAAAPERQAFVEHPGCDHFMPEADWDRLWEGTLGWLFRYLQGCST